MLNRIFHAGMAAAGGSALAYGILYCAEISPPPREWIVTVAGVSGAIGLFFGCQVIGTLKAMTRI